MGLGIRVQGLGIIGFRALGLVFRLYKVSGSRVQGLGFRFRV